MKAGDILLLLSAVMLILGILAMLWACNPFFGIMFILFVAGMALKYKEENDDNGTEL